MPARMSMVTEHLLYTDKHTLTCYSIAYMKLPDFKDIDRLVVFYMFTLTVLFFVLIEIPTLVTGGVSIFREEQVELILLAIVSVVGAAIYRAYRKEIDKKDRAYMELIQHVGILNRQVEQVDSLTKILKKIPESKNDMKLLLQEMTRHVLEIVPSDWVVVRAIDAKTGKTLTEQGFSRGKTVLLKYEISNDDLLSGTKLNEYSVIASNQENTHVKAFCLIPHQTITDEQRVLIKAIVNEIVLLYLIFTSTYYKK